MEKLVQLITDDTHRSPKLLVSCYGGAEGFTMTDSLEREFMSGIGQLATTEGDFEILSNYGNKLAICFVVDVWVLTTGLNAGVSKLIGQGIDRHILLHENVSKPTVIGITSWGTITEYTRSSLKAEVLQISEKNSKCVNLSLEDEVRLIGKKEHVDRVFARFFKE